MDNGIANAFVKRARSHVIHCQKPRVEYLMHVIKIDLTSSRRVEIYTLCTCTLVKMDCTRRHPIAGRLSALPFRRRCISLLEERPVVIKTKSAASPLAISTYLYIKYQVPGSWLLEYLREVSTKRYRSCLMSQTINWPTGSLLTLSDKLQNTVLRSVPSRDVTVLFEHH